MLTADKRLVEVTGRHAASGAALSGYEIHIGRTQGPDTARPFALLGESGEPDGAVSANGRIAGTYVHGLFASDTFRAGLLAELGSGSTRAYEGEIDRTLDALAAHLEASLDIDALLEIARAR